MWGEFRKALAGEPIGNTRATLDRFGSHLTTATLPGDGWRTQHDCLLWRLVEDAREMGVPVQPDVYGLFAASIPQEGRRRFEELPKRKRQGLVPDMLCTLSWDGVGPARRLLFELKTLHFGGEATDLLSHRRPKMPCCEPSRSWPSSGVRPQSQTSRREILWHLSRRGGACGVPPTGIRASKRLGVWRVG